MLLLRYVKNFSFGALKVEMQDIKAIAEKALQRSDDTVEQSAAAVGTATLGVSAGPTARSGGASSIGEATPASVEREIRPGVVSDDPWKGVFGGKSEANGRRLRAEVKPLTANAAWFAVRLAVESTAPRSNPLTGSVQFFLHRSFINDRPTVPVDATGHAELTFAAYGAFTVGASADGGKTRLELDLAELTDAPLAFRER